VFDQLSGFDGAAKIFRNARFAHSQRQQFVRHRVTFAGEGSYTKPLSREARLRLFHNPE
jgi:hypothetical protein